MRDSDTNIHPPRLVGEVVLDVPLLPHKLQNQFCRAGCLQPAVQYTGAFMEYLRRIRTAYRRRLEGKPPYRDISVRFGGWEIPAPVCATFSE